MRKLLLLFAPSIISGCALGSGVTQLYTQNGQPVYQAMCNGNWRTMGDCYAQANQHCKGASFTPVDRDSTSSFAAMNGGYVPVSKRTLMFTCDSKPAASTP